MSLTLAIDTSVGVSVALCDGGVPVAERVIDHHGVQGEQTAVLVRDLLADCGWPSSHIERIVVGVGPGPFTGLRVGLATGAAMGLALTVPVVGVCSLDAVVWDSDLSDGVAVSDARRKELYYLPISSGQPGEPGVAAPADIAERYAGIDIVGPAAHMYAPQVSGTVIALRAAALVASLDAGHSTARLVTPLYLRRPDAQPSVTRKSVMG